MTTSLAARQLAALDHFMAVAEHGLCIRSAVEEHRAADSAIRGIRRNEGRTAATTRALAAHEATIAWAVEVLVKHGEHALAGHLTDEAFTAERLRVARVAGQERPELLARQRATRRRVAAILEARAA